MTIMAPISVMGSVAPKTVKDSGSIGMTALPSVRKPMPMYPIMYRSNKIVARNRADGLNRFSKYSGIDRILE